MDGSLWQVHVHRCCHNPFVIHLDMVASTAAGSEENYLNDDCGCLLHTYSLRTWFLGLGFLMAETLLVVDTCPCGVVLFAGSKVVALFDKINCGEIFSRHKIVFAMRLQFVE